MQITKDIKSLKSKLANRPGIAVDIDETISWTIGWWVERMQKLFGNPENLSVHQIIEKYNYTQNVPYWRTKEALDWMEARRQDNEVQKELPLIEGAISGLEAINKAVGIAAYITVRPKNVEEGTKYWLDIHNFPKAETVFRPDKIEHKDGNKWKAKVLEYLYPEVTGIIDDNPELIKYLDDSYKGHIYLYTDSYVPRVDSRIDVFSTWKDIVRGIIAKN